MVCRKRGLSVMGQIRSDTRLSDWHYRILGITDSTHAEVRVEQAAADRGDYDVVKEDCACVSRREVVVNKNVLDVHIPCA